MNKKNNLILIFIISSLILLINSIPYTSATNTNFEISGSGIDQNIGAPDNLSFSGTNILFYDQFSDEYNIQNKRIKILKSGAKMNSELYGTFIITSNGIDLIKNNTFNINCNGVSYTFSGAIVSSNDDLSQNGPDGFWGKIKTITNDNYYCPASGKFNLPFKSNTIGKIVFSSNPSVKYITVINSYGKAIQVNVKKLFDSKKIYINGSYLKSKNIDNSSFEGELTKDLNEIQSQINIDGKITNLDSIVKKNVVILTKNRKPDGIGKITDLDLKLNNKIIDSNTKNLYYFNYKGKEDIGISHLNNKGKILQIGNGWINSNNGNFSKIEVNGKNTLIIDGGNLYINTDIYNKNDKSILAIIVKRDKTNRKNGGNIYINPGVTNIDAVLIADGSIFNYNQSVKTEITNKNILRRQLLIYGAVSTKNTIGGGNKAPYGSDDYIKNGGSIDGTTPGEYDLKNLRTFQAISNTQLEIGDICADPNNDKITAMGDSNTKSLKYAFAGKKKCYLKDSGIGSLRVTDKLSPLVIVYNPLIQINPPKILKIK